MTRPVLIVEDDPDIAEGLKYNLEREGLETRVALTGEQGLQAALDPKNPPALVLLDLMLPGMSGTELCRRLRREPQTRRTPIIMLTARGAESERVAGLRAARREHDDGRAPRLRSEEHTSELQSRPHLVCRLLLEK